MDWVSLIPEISKIISHSINCHSKNIMPPSSSEKLLFSPPGLPHWPAVGDQRLIDDETENVDDVSSIKLDLIILNKNRTQRRSNQVSTLCCRHGSSIW